MLSALEHSKGKVRLFFYKHCKASNGIAFLCHDKKLRIIALRICQESNLAIVVHLKYFKDNSTNHRSSLFMFETSSCAITLGAFLDFDAFFDDLRCLCGLDCSVSLEKNYSELFTRSLVREGMMNLERVSIRNEILFRRDLSIMNSISHVNTG